MGLFSVDIVHHKDMKIFFCAGITSVVMAFAAITVSACSCGWPSVEESVKNADIVVIAKYLDENADRSARFKILKAWKGARVGDTRSFGLFDLGGCDKDIILVPGTSYLFFVSTDAESQKMLKTKRPTIFVDCSRNAPVDDEFAVEDIRKLNEKKKW